MLFIIYYPNVIAIYYVLCLVTMTITAFNLDRCVEYTMYSIVCTTSCLHQYCTNTGYKDSPKLIFTFFLQFFPIFTYLVNMMMVMVMVMVMGGKVNIV